MPIKQENFISDPCDLSIPILISRQQVRRRECGSTLFLLYLLLYALHRNREIGSRLDTNCLQRIGHNQETIKKAPPSRLHSSPKKCLVQRRYSAYINLTNATCNKIRPPLDVEDHMKTKDPREIPQERTTKCLNHKISRQS